MNQHWFISVLAWKLLEQYTVLLPHACGMSPPTKMDESLSLKKKVIQTSMLRLGCATEIAFRLSTVHGNQARVEPGATFLSTFLPEFP